IGSNENASDLIHAECYVDPLDPEDEVEWNSSCAGGEVRGVVKITCSLAPDGTSVTVKTKGILYEETTCANNDEDGSTERTTPPIAACPPGSPADCTGISLNAQ